MADSNYKLIADMVEDLEDQLIAAVHMIEEIYNNYPNIHKLYQTWEQDAEKMLARYGRPTRDGAE